MWGRYIGSPHRKSVGSWRLEASCQELNGAIAPPAPRYTFHKNRGTDQMPESTSLTSKLTKLDDSKGRVTWLRIDAIDAIEKWDDEGATYCCYLRSGDLIKLSPTQYQELLMHLKNSTN
jgi:hypothetical protein